MSKLTLSINEAIIEEAKKYAKSNGKSLSNIVEEYLKSLTIPENPQVDTERSSLVDELKGCVKLPKNFTSYEDLLQDELVKKYLKK